MSRRIFVFMDSTRVGQAERECVRDVDVALMDGAGEFDGGFELAAGGPRQPGVQQPHPFRAAGRDTFRNCSLSRYARYSGLLVAWISDSFACCRSVRSSGRFHSA